ncbi:MAG: hypothetical protein AAFP84_14505 [Actinomycetota bacterium]
MTDQQPATESITGVSSESYAESVVIDEALSVIDGALAKMMQRELVSSGEVADLLLDVRTLLTESSTSAVTAGASAQITEIEPVTSDS